MMNFCDNKTFLITGGAGFIGINLTKKIIELGGRVIIIDDLSSSRRENILPHKNLKVHFCKLQDFNLCDLSNLSGVFHLAAQVSITFSIANFYKSSSNNNLSSIKIIDYCSKNNVPLIYASSAAVYGNLELGDENANVDLLHPYSLDKYILELYSKMANNLYGLKSCGLRFFNVYGPHQNGDKPYSGVISIFINNLLKQKSININGGQQERNFIFVEDVVEALLSSYEYTLNNSIAEVFNVLSNRATSIKEIANLIQKILGVQAKINYKDLDKSDLLRSVGSPNNIAKKIGFLAKTDINTGLKSTIKWMKVNNKT